MPGWHAKTKDLVAKGELQVYGIAPEQYGDRMALFLQWKELDFPVLMDPLNLLGVKSVPMTFLVDESGMIRFKNPKAKELKEFLGKAYSSTKKRTPAEFPQLTQAMTDALLKDSARGVEQCLLLAERMKEESSLSTRQSFEAGVIARWLYDNKGEPELFQKAVSYWAAALKEVPGQYIWRRRIQQYGPRLDKPYPFYNWVEEARKEVKKRGEDPVELQVEPSGSEVALPLRKNKAVETELEFPDTKNQLPQAEGALEATTTLIPHTDRKGQFRLHLRLSPEGQNHWSSEAQELSLWLLSEDKEPVFLSSDASLIAENQEISSEPRILEIDLSLKGKKKARLVLFYSLCESEEGVCRFLRSDWKVGE